MRTGHLGPAAAILALAALLLLALGRHTDWDLRLADAMYDAAAGDFPVRHAWWAEVLVHGWLKWGLTGLSLAGLALVAWDAARPLPCLTGVLRQRLRVAAGCAALIPLLVALLKQASPLHCPWDIDRYGGMAPYLRLLDALPAGLEPGHCFPAGHATSALWLAALALLWGPRHARATWATFGAGLAAGFALGGVQQMRGAHFLSHTLWSVWIAAAVVLAAAGWLRRIEGRPSRLALRSGDVAWSGAALRRPH